MVLGLTGEVGDLVGLHVEEARNIVFEAVKIQNQSSLVIIVLVVLMILQHATLILARVSIETYRKSSNKPPWACFVFFKFRVFRSFS